MHLRKEVSAGERAPGTREGPSEKAEQATNRPPSVYFFFVFCCFRSLFSDSPTLIYLLLHPASNLRSATVLFSRRPRPRPRPRLHTKQLRLVSIGCWILLRTWPVLVTVTVTRPQSQDSPVSEFLELSTWCPGTRHHSARTRPRHPRHPRPLSFQAPAPRPQRPKAHALGLISHRVSL